MTKKLGSTLARSVRRAKEKQPQNSTLNTQQDSESPKFTTPELPLPSIPSRRVWPD
ncbi:hypothetical protein MNBD_GAMMA16-1342 [hydrothermal vent metagenome]|uniref:Uncharacterized protein n=1 Tax=hydrothermal vent metagenome TaxID=652676 RepID=A0A3B0ZW14_9ZZZZ